MATSKQDGTKGPYGASNCSVTLDKDDIVVRVFGGAVIGKVGEWKKPDLADPEKVGVAKAEAYRADSSNLRKKNLIGTTGGFCHLGHFAVSVNVTTD